MSAEQNVATIKGVYEAFGRGDVDWILERCTDDVDWASDVASAVAPWQGVKRGKSELPSFFTAIAQAGAVKEFTPLAFAGNDDGEVMALVHWSFTVSATGRDLASNIHQYFRFREGKIAYYRGSEDSAQVAWAFGA